MKILYVEDNSQDADLTIRTLKKTAPEFKIDIVNTQKHALSILDGPDFSHYDLVLTDMNLPDGDGIFIVNHIRLHSLPLGIVLLTGQGDEETAVSALKSGANDYVLKRPGYLDHLHTYLKNALDHYQTEISKRKKPIKVLYVEHHQVDVDLTCRHFERYASHIQLDIANQGSDLFSRIGDEKGSFFYDVLLLDYRLPRTNALEILKDMKIHFKIDIPVVLITGKGDEEVAVAALKLGAADYVVKNSGYLFKLPSIIENAFHSSLFARQHIALKESEEKYRVMMESMKDPVYICSPDFKVEYMNPAMIKRIGYDAVGEYCFKALHDLKEKCSWCTHHLIQLNKSSEMDIVSPKDNRSFLVSSSPIIHGDGSVSKMTVYRDMTDFKKMEVQFQQAQKMESVGRLAGGVAHDYNNALSVIMGYTEMAMIDADPKGPLYNDLNEVLKAAKSATNITRQLLAFARKQTADPEVLDLNKSIETMFKMLRRLIGEDIDLVLVSGKDLWTIKMDPTQIDQILANLCVNARDAIKGVGKITIETSKIALDKAYCEDNLDFIPGQYVLLTVSDNGCGMDKEILNKIFEPFFTTKNIDKGTGLGLSTVYGIVKQNNGFIKVYSESDKGTSIKIYLPRHKGKAAQILEQSTADIPEGRGEIILLVEDELAILKLTRKILTSIGYTVLSSDKPKKAMEMAREYADTINLLIADVIMPEMNGRDLSEQLKILYPDLKCIFMSGYTANVIARHGVLDEEVAFVQKPFTKRDLAVKVRKILDEQ